MARTQEFRQLAIATPLGEDVLLLRSMVGTERLGRLYKYRLDLVSEDPSIVLADIVGHNVTVRTQMSPEGKPRHFNGFVSRFSVVRMMGQTTQYRATMVPWLWFLTRTSDCRIFQDMTVPDIIKKVFRDHGFTDFEDRLAGSYRQWEYCVQYCETDFNFVSRLMEQEGIFYYFLHENGKHTLVLANASSTHDPVPGYEEIPYFPPTASMRDREYIFEWEMEQKVQPGVFSHCDFDFKNPKKHLLTSAKVPRPYATPDFEVYEYPGEYLETAEGEGYARRRIEAYHTEYEVARGEGEVRGITTGRRFVLTGHPRADQCKQYLVTSTTIRATSDLFESRSDDPAPPGEDTGGANYSVKFSGIEIYEPYRPRRVTPKPMIRGPQTAMVVGPSAEDIYTDEYGRVKVQFHWDRYSKADENSSCWIRVAQHWAGKKWGTMFIPRIGHEVIVEFLEGDPDHPIITGRVYSGDTMPPYDLPANMTMSTIKTLSSKGGGGFNEIRFEDKKGEEQIFIHGEKNVDVRLKNDRFEFVGNDQHLIVKKDKFEHVENNRHEKVDMDHAEEIGKDRHLKIKGKQAVDVTGSNSLTVTGDVIEVFKANHSEEVTGNLYLKAAGIVVEATGGITLKSGSSNVVIDSAGVSISGATITIDGQSMTKIACGPGSPAAVGVAGLAVTPAAPAAAEEADTADPGEMTEVKARQRETKAGKYGSVQTQPYKPPETPEEKETKKSWIEVELIDNLGNPVPGEKYKVTLPDGKTVAEGTLDEKGFVHIDGIEPGTCRITFPDLDGRSWDRA